jgi:type II secretory pathway component PulF
MIEYASNRTTRVNAAKPPNRWLGLLFDLCWMFGGIVFVIGLGGALGGLLAPVVGYSAPGAGILILVAFAVLGRSRRRTRALSAVNYLEQAVRLNLPLPAMLSAAQSAERGALHRRLGRLRNRIEAGFPLSVALRREIPGVPARTIGLLAAGEELGQLPLAMARIVRRPQPSRPANPAHSILLRWYPMTMLIAVPAIAAMLNVFVMPKYKQLFADFGITMPWVTRTMLDVSDAVQLPLLIFIIIVFVLFCGRMLSEAATASRAAFWIWRGWIDRIVWIMPVWRDVVRSRGMADLCYLLAGATETGQPIDRILLESAEACGNSVLSRRILRWSSEMNRGVPIADAARKAGMPKLLVGMLNTARGAQGVRSVFVFLAQYYDNRQSVAAAFLEAAAVPVMVGITAFFVAWIALSMFMPLITLINNLPQTRNVTSL